MNPHLRPHPSPHQPHDTVADNRHRRWPISSASPPPLDWEVEEVLRFARIWAPYGGAPADETFHHFGMSTSRFVDKLWEILRDRRRRPYDADQLAAVFPPPAAQAATFQETCVAHPGAYASGAVLGVHATKKVGNNREESCKVYDASNKLLGTTYRTTYGFYGTPPQVNPPAQSAR
ncbi:hypothetical protein [Rhodococcus oxybenzonivorans]|uniref:hypothetical protein n=1 Tax=Rhodococcus oxybenzonivorans TaxID=1990687 RepID=UPI00194F12FE|nr:hypothetical protein [Rhodococcus oxybenzonivorans]